MDIQRKIEEIRQKPEHIRLRYVWAMVGISMAIIVGIWILSLRNEYGRAASRMNTGNYQGAMSQFTEGKQSLEDVMKEFQGVMEEVKKEEEEEGEWVPQE